MLFTLLLAVVALEPSPLPTSVAPGGAAQDTKLICKFETETGYRIGKRVCRTRQAWEEMAEAAQRDMRQRSRNAGDPGQR